MTNIAEHIDIKPGRCGGKPCVVGTRIRVWDIHVWHELRGWSPAEIVTQFPQLTLADVYAALAYYHDHCDEIEQQMREADEFAEKLRGERASSPPPDRSSWPTRLGRLSEEGDDVDALALTPAERIEMMWPLAVHAWAFLGEDVSGSQFQRHVVRVERRGG